MLVSFLLCSIFVLTVVVLCGTIRYVHRYMYLSCSEVAVIMSLASDVDYVKSPLNYTGGKHKLLGQLFPLFPSDISTFFDLFGGGFNVGVNAGADTIVYNDINTRIVDLIQYFYLHDTVDGLDMSIMSLSEEYDLLRNDNPEGYLALRDDYNASPSLLKLYVLIACSFSNSIRFNSKGFFNVPYGKRYYNPMLRSRMVSFLKVLRSKNVLFHEKSFTDFSPSLFQPSDFVYLDPPYLNASAMYNEYGGWTEKDEGNLLEFLDALSERNVRWALSNNLKLENNLLHSWMDKYHVHCLDSDYASCNYQKKDKSKDIEVLITNYVLEDVS